MINFSKYYLSEKQILTYDQRSKKEIKPSNDRDKKCIAFGKDLADKYGVILNGWGEMMYYFSIPAGVPDAENTFTANNEAELLEKIKDKFPKFYEYISKKVDIPENPDDSEPPKECDVLTMADIAAGRD